MTTRDVAEVGKIVASRRAELKMSAAELASAAEVDPKTLRSLERGERWPRDTSLRKIEEALGWIPGALDTVRQGGTPRVNTPEDREQLRHYLDVKERVDAIADSSAPEPDVLDLLMELLGDLPDGGSREKVQQLYDELAIRDFDQLFQRLSRQGKVQVVRHAGRILLLEENGTPISSFFTGSPNDHVIYPTAEEFERNRHDVTKESTTASRQGEANPRQKTSAAKRRLRKVSDLTYPHQDEGVEPPMYPPAGVPVAADEGGAKGIETPPGEEDFSQDPEDHQG
ncbi:immunity repressor [Gordonia phage Lton]|nr:immunity repressor [Gordonia phage Lton]